MFRRLSFLLVALLLVAGSAQAQIQCWGEGCGRPFTSPILLPAGSLSAPAVAPAADPTTGFNFGATFADWIGTNSARVRITTSASGGALVVQAGSGGACHYGFGPSGVTSTDLCLTRGSTSGALRLWSGTTPTIAGCGTGATASGNNSNGAVTIGTTPGTCVITFHGTWSNAPHCTLNNERAAGAGGQRATGITTTQFTITGTIAATDVISWFCVGP